MEAADPLRPAPDSVLAPEDGKSPGMPTEARRRRLGGSDVVIGLGEAEGHAGIAAQAGTPEVLLHELPGWARYLAVLAIVGLAAAFGIAADGVVSDGAIGMVFLAAVVGSAVALGPLYGVVGAALAFLSWNFLFLPPRYTFHIAGAQTLVGAAVFGVVALLLAGTAGGLRQSARTARARLFGLRRLVEFSRRLGAPGTTGDLLVAAAQELERVAGCPACVLMPLEAGGVVEPVVRAAVPTEEVPDEGSMAAARWALANGRPAGSGTAILPSAAWQFRPMRTARGIVGLVGLRPLPGDRSGRLDGERGRTLDALLDQAAVAIERAELMEERARGEARAETEALRSALLASVSHDLRTPLTAIRGALETLRISGDALPPETRTDLLATAEEETARLGRYLANVLDIVRLEGRQIVPKRELVDVPEAIDAAVARAERAHRRPVRRELGPRLPALRLDPVLLDQVLSNLLDNALKFSGPDGRVAVAAWREGPEVAIAVEDDGPGIPPADLGRVFDPFFRATRTDRVAAGSGLGLAICRGLAAAMGGRIAAESPVRDGRGTRMTLRFPASW
jgi:two-component system, OmpR family, sensor histidine kinase KdpD